MNQTRTTYRFEGQQATLQHMLLRLNRAVRNHRLIRVEVRLSNEVPKPLALGQARAAMVSLLRERGLNQVAVSVRPHALALDDALAEHHLVLIEAPKPPTWQHRIWLAMAKVLLRWRARRGQFQATHASHADMSVEPSGLDSASTDKTSAISPREVGLLMRSAALQALHAWPVRAAGTWEVQRIHVRLRTQELSDATAQLMPPTASSLLTWLATVGQRTDLVASSGITLVVEQLPGAGDGLGTALVGEGDLSIELTSATPTKPVDLAGTELPQGA